MGLWWEVCVSKACPYAKSVCQLKTHLFSDVTLDIADSPLILIGLCPATMIQGRRARACRSRIPTACINMTFGLVKVSSHGKNASFDWSVGQVIWKPPRYWQIPVPSPTTEVVSLLLLGDSTFVGCKLQCTMPQYLVNSLVLRDWSSKRIHRASLWVWCMATFRPESLWC